MRNASKLSRYDRSEALRWRNAMLSANNIADTVKLVLLTMENRTHLGTVISIPRSDLAKWLHKSPARITEAVTVAVEAGWLQRIVKGEPGVTAEYRMVMSTTADGPRVRTKRAHRLDTLIPSGSLEPLGNGLGPRVRTKSSGPLGTPHRTKQGVHASVPQTVGVGVHTRGQPSTTTTAGTDNLGALGAPAGEHHNRVGPAQALAGLTARAEVHNDIEQLDLVLLGAPRACERPGLGGSPGDGHRMTSTAPMTANVQVAGRSTRSGGSRPIAELAIAALRVTA